MEKKIYCSCIFPKGKIFPIVVKVKLEEINCYSLSELQDDVFFKIKGDQDLPSELISARLEVYTVYNCF